MERETWREKYGQRNSERGEREKHEKRNREVARGKERNREIGESQI